MTTTIPFFKVLGSTNDIEYRVTNFQFRGQAVETVYRQKLLESDLNVELITGQLETFREKSENVGAIDANFNSNVGKGWNIETKLSSLLSTTGTKPILGSIVQNGKFSACALLELVKALNNVDLPTFGRPTIPHLKPIIIFD